MLDLESRYRPVWCSIEHALPCGCGGIVYAGKYDPEEISKAISYHEGVCPKAEKHQSFGSQSRPLLGTAIAMSVLNQEKR